MRIRLFAPLGAAVLALGLTACDSNSGGSGHLRVRMTDAPSDDFSAANVTITRVEVIGADSTASVVTSTSKTLNLLALRNGLTAVLGDVTLPEGRYSQIRLVVDETSNVVYKDGTTEALKIPSGTTSGLKINVPAFTVDAERDSIDVTLDFDVNESFVKAGNSGKYIFKPVIRPLYLVVNGDTLRSGLTGDND